MKLRRMTGSLIPAAGLAAGVSAAPAQADTAGSVDDSDHPGRPRPGSIDPTKAVEVGQSRPVLAERGPEHRRHRIEGSRRHRPPARAGHHVHRGGHLVPVPDGGGERHQRSGQRQAAHPAVRELIPGPRCGLWIHSGPEVTTGPTLGASAKRLVDDLLLLDRAPSTSPMMAPTSHAGRSA